MSTYQKYQESYKRGLIGFATLSILGQSCLGSFAAMFILMGGTSPLQMVQLFFVTIFCMIYNGAVLSQQKANVSFTILTISVLTSLLFIALNFNVLF
ncbi:hypothetical protein GR160_09310 [Flavobacterium sp. Sd200]|uniref:hypothetical protein n=1 Tax=Flavobacterium sp. Sd200 TaxID=2692211 RepID=UPI0013695258|nr:hypothetical protein [Flavobacterium sp. Sd200]MXN91426.1 hypothetical protein [Flavobacterium sp. Sd200]